MTSGLAEPVRVLMVPLFCSRSFHSVSQWEEVVLRPRASLQAAVMSPGFSLAFRRFSSSSRPAGSRGNQELSQEVGKPGWTIFDVYPEGFGENRIPFPCRARRMRSGWNESPHAGPGQDGFLGITRSTSSVVLS